MANPRIEDLRKRLEKEPGSRLFAQLAEELRKDGDLVEAIRVCREGLQKQPNYPSAHMTLGRALFDNGDLTGARAEFDAVLKGAPDNILASRLLGECLERLGDTQGALARFRTTLALAPGDRQVTAKIQALEQSVPLAEATLIMPSSVEPPRPAPLRQAWPPPAEAGPSGAAAAAPAAVPAELPAIAVSQVADESFELEQPYEAPTLVGVATPYGIEPGGQGRPAGVVESEAIGVVGDLEESFEPEAGPGVAAMAAPGVAARPSVPATPLASVGPAPEASFDFDAGPERIESWSAPPTTQPAEPTPAQTPSPVPEAPQAHGTAGLEMSTATLAELYLSQGVLDKAIDVYRQLLEREPGNDRARTRLGEIEKLEGQLRQEEALAAAEGATAATPAASRRQAVERTIARLEALLAALKRS